MSAAAVLTVIRNGEEIKSYEIDGEAVIGRAEGCVIRLEDRAISRQHAVLRASGEGVSVEKKSEFAPLVVNGAECSQAILKEGDVISIGPYLMRLRMRSADQPAEAPPPPEAVTPVEPASQDSVPEPQINLDLPQPENLAAPEIIETVDEDAKTKITPAAKVDVKLVFAAGTANVTEYEISKDEVFIGRGKNCDVVLNDKKASRKNAVIRRAGLNFIIRDLDSANGTFVNGIRIKEHELAGDDEIRVAGVEFQFKALSLDYKKRESGFMSVPDVEPSPMAVIEPVPDQAGAPGNTGGITGIAGLGATKKKQSLMEKFRALPKSKQYMVIAVVIVFLYIFNFGDDDKPKKAAPKKQAAQAATAAQKGPLTFESLSPELQKFVEHQHDLAFDYFRNKDYDNALVAVHQILHYVSDYKDTKDIETYALEGQRRMKAIEEEKQKKAEEERIKEKVSELVGEAGKLMDQKSYGPAKDLFAQILSLDPENLTVAGWQKTIDQYEENKRRKAQEAQVQKEINQHAWEIYRDGLTRKKEGHFHRAIGIFQKAIDIGASDRKVITLSREMIHACKTAIAAARDPVLKEAKSVEDSGNFEKAYELYKKATIIDPPYPVGYAGMSRVKSVLHERAKAIYTEAVLAESYSDFATAKAKFQECLKAAPPGDSYHDRAERKLSYYFKDTDEVTQ